MAWVDTSCRDLSKWINYFSDLAFVLIFYGIQHWERIWFFSRQAGGVQILTCICSRGGRRRWTRPAGISPNPSIIFWTEHLTSHFMLSNIGMTCVHLDLRSTGPLLYTCARHFVQLDTLQLELLLGRLLLGHPTSPFIEMGLPLPPYLSAPQSEQYGNIFFLMK